jgi:hypothetical protein
MHTRSSFDSSLLRGLQDISNKRDGVRAFVCDLHPISERLAELELSLMKSIEFTGMPGIADFTPGRFESEEEDTLISARQQD